MRIYLRSMRKSTSLAALLPGTRQAVLTATLMHPGRWWYLSDLAHHLGVPPSKLQRELARLVAGGILRKRREGNRTYFQANADCPFYPELRGLIVKTSGVVDVLREALRSRTESITWAFVYGSLASAKEEPTSDVDLMIVGRVGLAEVAPALRSAERRLGRAVNATVYRRGEFVRKLRGQHHFLQTVMKQPKLYILGSPDGLEAVPS